MVTVSLLDAPNHKYCLIKIFLYLVDNDLKIDRILAREKRLPLRLFYFEMKRYFFDLKKFNDCRYTFAKFPVSPLCWLQAIFV